MNKLIETNKKLSKKYKWEPKDFGSHDFNEELIESIKQFQKQFNLEIDGLAGEMTVRRLVTEKESKKIVSQKYIIFNDQEYPIEWDKVITFKDDPKWTLPSKCYKKANRTKEDIKMFVTHFDVCLSSQSCFNVLKDRGLSVCWLIDNDGTIIQLLDPKHVAWHAAGVNTQSVGVEISNAFYEKYNASYEKMGFGKRPVLSNSVVHGQKLESHLGYYQVQIEALKALIKVVHKCLDIPLNTPKSNTTVPEVENGTYEGFVCHYHVTRKKIDAAGINLINLIAEL